VWPTLTASQPALVGEGQGTWWQITSVALVALLYAASVLRRGARGFLGELRFELSST
jgi:hypothetical protein